MIYEYTTISFPGLGLEFNPARMLELGPLKIHFYGVIIALGLILAVLYGWKRAKPLGFDQDKMTDGVLWIVQVFSPQEDYLSGLIVKQINEEEFEGYEPQVDMRKESVDNE